LRKGPVFEINLMDTKAFSRGKMKTARLSASAETTPCLESDHGAIPLPSATLPTADFCTEDDVLLPRTLFKEL